MKFSVKVWNTKKQDHDTLRKRWDTLEEARQAADDLAAAGEKACVYFGTRLAYRPKGTREATR